MKLVVQADGREETVEIVRDGEDWRVTVGDATYRVDAAPLGAAETARGGQPTRSLTLGGDQYEVSAHPVPRRGTPADSGDRYRVSFGAARPAVEVEVLDPLAHQARAAHGAAAGSGPQKVTAMMPGRVVALLVEEGDAVEAGQAILVLEAMKMENDIAAEAPGVVRRILVEEGQAVDGGEPLFEIGPAEGEPAS